MEKTKKSKPRNKKMSSEMLIKDFSGDKFKNIYDCVAVTRKGISKASLLNLSKQTSLSIKELADVMSITQRTIQRYGNGDYFKPNVSEKVIEIASLYSKGFKVFKDEENFKSWMETSNIALGGEKPKGLLDTSFGIEMIKDVLGRIEHGVFS